MGVLDLIKKISKILTKCTFERISTRTKILLALAVALLIKFFLRQHVDPRNIIKMPISEFLSSLNLRSIESVNIYPNEIVAVDKFSNILKSKYAGLSSQYLFN